MRAYQVALGFLLLTVNGLAALGLLDLAFRGSRPWPPSSEDSSSGWGGLWAWAEPRRYGPWSGPVASAPGPRRSDYPWVPPQPFTVRSSR